MSDATLSLGPIVFRDFEIPASITFGGRQRLAVHYLSTGRRVTDILGPDDAAISFAGVLSGPLAAGRAREIDTLRTLGQPLALAWNTFKYPVLIAAFQAEYRNQWWIPYKISCSVIENPVLVDFSAALSMTDEALAALNLMYNIVPAALLPIPDTRSAIASYAAGSSPAGLAATATTLHASVAALQTQQQHQEAKAAALSTDSPIPIGQFIEGFGSIVQAAENIQFLALSQDCIGQAAVYLARTPYNE